MAIRVYVFGCVLLRGDREDKAIIILFYILCKLGKVTLPDGREEPQRHRVCLAERRLDSTPTCLLTWCLGEKNLAG